MTYQPRFIFLLILAVFSLMFILSLPVQAVSAPVPSNKTQFCLGCHSQLNPGLVSDWENSRHSWMTPQKALEKDKLKRRFSAENIPTELKDKTVGCAECHLLNPEKHKDTFNHNGQKVHTIVSPQDCATCHPKEHAQYKKNKMSFAYKNLVNNLVYDMIISTSNGLLDYDPKEGISKLKEPDRLSNEDSCLFCHGTKVKVTGIVDRNTPMGTMEFADLQGWPNQGVGRINPDGSLGSCSACHARHEFSIAMARQPHTCSECHKGPDVPAYKVYEVSKHGNIFFSRANKWNLDPVPWTVGQDFTSPSCASCHVSLLVQKGGSLIINRSHQMNDRLYSRIFGLPYAHPQPKSPDTSIIKNKSGLPLPTELSGEPVDTFLIGKQEQESRKKQMKKVCLSCHSAQWTDNHFIKLDRSLETTNHMTKQATKILKTAWQEGLAKGLSAEDSITNELIELQWVEQWLFYGNSIRFASAMAGADYGVFANGRWYQHKNLRIMIDRLKNLRQRAKGSN